MQKFLKTFPALKHKNYRLFFIGQFVSLIGTWLQMVAQGWLVFTLTNSAFWVGMVAAAASFPVLAFSLFGGVIVDRFDKRKIIIFTQIVSMILAFILGGLTVAGVINIFEITVLAFLLGVVTVLDNPARQAFVIEMVGKEDLASAIALNSGIFNGARIIGPGIAGLLIALFGVGETFLINGVSYVAVIIALLFIGTRTILPETHPHPLKAIKEGLRYSFSHPTIRTLLFFAAVSSIFGWSYATIMPVIAQTIFHQGATGLGYLYSATGVGAVLGTVFVSAFSKKISPRFFILGGSVLFAVSLILFSLTTSLKFALPLLFFSGLGLVSHFAMINSTIQHLVSDHVRGRVMSIYMLMFLGMQPLGSFQVGFMAEHFGSSWAIRFGAFVILIFGGFVYFNKNFRQKVEKPQTFAGLQT